MRQFDLDLANRRAGGTIGLQRFPVNADRFFVEVVKSSDVLARDDYCPVVLARTRYNRRRSPSTISEYVLLINQAP